MLQRQEETQAIDLMRRWRNVYQEAISLAAQIEHLPDECPCSDADGHLDGRCPCCGTRLRSGTSPAGSLSCTDLLANLRADLALLCEDFARVAGPVKAVALETRRVTLRREIVLTADDLERVVSALAQVDRAVAGFRRSCTVTEMRGLKGACADLRTHCERLNSDLGEQ